jgi:hypothetical protein
MLGTAATMSGVAGVMPPPKPRAKAAPSTTGAATVDTTAALAGVAVPWTNLSVQYTTLAAASSQTLNVAKRMVQFFRICIL